MLQILQRQIPSINNIIYDFFAWYNFLKFNIARNPLGNIGTGEGHNLLHVLHLQIGKRSQRWTTLATFHP